MMAIKRISEFFDAKANPLPELKKKQSSFKPVTRLEKIRQKDYVYPASTSGKFIFAANLDGSGFQRKHFPLCPEEIPLDEMVEQINKVCYREWERSKTYSEVHPFKYLDRYSNVSFLLAAVLAMVLLMMVVYGDAHSINNVLFMFTCFLASSLVACLIVYFTKISNYNPDVFMVNAVKEKIAEFNREEMKEGSPRFVWTSHKDCIWIAIRIIKGLPSRNTTSSPQSEMED